MKKFRLLLSAGLAILLLLLFTHMYNNYAILWPGLLNGAYVAGSGPYQISFSANTSDGTFFYTDQASGVYIKGELLSQNDGAYLLTCSDPANSALLPDQELSCDDLTLSLTVGGQPVSFEKINRVPIILGSREYYS